jgi:hypothetical protein
MNIIQITWWMVVAIQAFGLGSAWLARVSIGTLLQGWGHSMFFGSMIASAATTFVSLMQNSGLWLFSAACLAGMILVVVLDFRPTSQRRSH